jgi:hypothetical protein
MRYKQYYCNFINVTPEGIEPPPMGLDSACFSIKRKATFREEANSEGCLYWPLHFRSCSTILRIRRSEKPNACPGTTEASQAR